MRPNDSRPDRELARALRRLDPPSPTSAQMAALARRIVTRAGPLLDARRRAALSSPSAFAVAKRCNAHQ